MHSSNSIVTLADRLLELLPEDGSPVLNRVLRTMLARAVETPVRPELYFATVDKLASEGRVGRSRGQGGKLFLTLSEPPSSPAVIEEVWAEAKLMAPLNEYLNGPFKTALDLPEGSTWLAVDTSAIGPRSGQWARPDFVAVSVMRFQLLPGRQVAVHSFELKTETGGTVQAVHETLAQTRFTHFGHLVWHLPIGSKSEARLPEVAGQCETHGIGLIIIRNPSDLESWEIRLDPVARNTTQATVDAFLLSRLSELHIQLVQRAVFGE